MKGELVEKPKRRQMVGVRVIRRLGKSSALQYLEGDKLKAVVVPAEVLEGDKADAAELEKGAPYGVAWSELVDLPADPEAVEQELYRQGLWTPEDVRTKPQRVMAALMTVYSPVLVAITGARQDRREVK